MAVIGKPDTEIPPSIAYHGQEHELTSEPSVFYQKQMTQVAEFKAYPETLLKGFVQNAQG
ncbi:MAG: hypothetical protein KME31_36740 [Tolypothrix carrinoi HA7290-LM1]|jgi:hypothetical protein|nr:hypothetical protein [Tolypothrix carrinoi HA7290-LM1]